MSTDAKKDDGYMRVSRRVECLGPGKTVLMPDNYAYKEVLGESSPDIEATGGFNPYLTTAMHKK